jgi:hypothetical protein
MENVIYEKGSYRILEVEDDMSTLEYLKGDCFKPDCNPGVSIEELELEEARFEHVVESKGVYGYVLEKWYPEIGVGWRHVDSCFGFIGRFDQECHAIVNELASQMME